MTRVRSSWSSPPMLQPMTARSPTLQAPAGGLQHERALVAAGDERGQRLADVDRERHEGADAERRLLLGDGGGRGISSSRQTIAETASPGQLRQFEACRACARERRVGGRARRRRRPRARLRGGPQARPDALRYRAHLSPVAPPWAARPSSRSARSPRCRARGRRPPALALAAGAALGALASREAARSRPPPTRLRQSWPSA